MILEEILHSAVSTINQEFPNLKLGIDRLNLYLKLVNYDYFKQWCGLPEDWKPGQPVTRRGWQIAEQNTEALKTFIVPAQNYVVDAYGKLNYPAGFVHLSSIGYYNSDIDTFVPVVEKMHSELYDLLRNPITPPTLEYPIIVYYNTYFQFYPINLMNVDMSYLRLPATPIYAIKQENGIDVYDSANSTQFEWPEQYHNDLIRMLIGYIAPASKDAGLTQFNETKKLQGV